MFENNEFLVNESAALVADVAVVGMYEVGYAPASNCALVITPVTVNVNVPAVGVKVNETLPVAVVPVNPPVNAPDKAVVPVP